MTRASAIIVAAGSGRRLGFDVPKAFVPLAGHPILYYSLRAIAGVPSIVEAVIAVPPTMDPAAREQVIAARLAIPVKITPGGAERQDSVRIALALTSAETDLVAVHDAARPLVTAELFTRCIEAATKSGGAIAAIPLADTLKRVEDGRIHETIPRASLYHAQTPQAFRRDLLIAAHREAARDSKVAATDDADLAERQGTTIEIVESTALNLKITTPTDLEIATALLRR